MKPTPLYFKLLLNNTSHQTFLGAAIEPALSDNQAHDHKYPAFQVTRPMGTSLLLQLMLATLGGWSVCILLFVWYACYN